MNNKIERINFNLFFMIVIAVYLLRFGGLRATDIHYSEWDSVTRFYAATLRYNSWFDGLIYRHTLWLPLQFYLIKIVQFVSKETSGIIYLSNFIYAVSFGYLYRIYSLFSPEKSNKLLFSVLLVIFSYTPILYYISLTTLAEPLSVALAIISFYYFLISAIYDKSPLLLFVFLTFNNLLRYEAWLITFFLGGYWLVQNFSKLNVLKASVLLLAPIFSLTKNYYISGDPLLFLTVTGKDALNYYDRSVANYFIKMKQLFQHLAFLVLPLVPIAFIERERMKSRWLLIVMLLLFLLAMPVTFKLVEPTQRYVLPVIGVFLVFCSLVFPLKKLGKLKIVLVWSCFLCLFLINYSMMEKVKKTVYRNLVPGDFSETIRFLKTLKVDSQNKIFIADVNWIRKLIRVKIPDFESDYFAEVHSIDSGCGYDLKKCLETYRKNKLFQRDSLTYLVFFRADNYDKYKNHFNRTELKDFVKIYDKESVEIFKRRDVK